MLSNAIRRLLPVGLLLLLVASCVPGRVKVLNKLGKQAYAEQKYDRAIGHFRESLGIYPNQPKIRQQLRNAKGMLKDIFIYRIYELVDSPGKPIETYLSAWKMAATLPQLGLPKARSLTVRVDMEKRFIKAEKRLHGSTEPHKYYSHLDQMSRHFATPTVDQAQANVADKLQQAHLGKRERATKAGLSGLGLLHAAAAATFAPKDTGLWGDVARRRRALLDKLALKVTVDAQSAVSARHSLYLLGGLKRRLPTIFKVARQSPLRLNLTLRRPVLKENRVRDRRSARCQVGTRRIPNPRCPVLRRQAKQTQKEFDARLRALDTARQRCAGAKPGVCTNYLREAERELVRTKRHFKKLNKEAKRCPATLTKPIFKTFFYERQIVTRSASSTGTVTIFKNGKPWRARGIVGRAEVRDSVGPGLSCARIPPDSLNLPSLPALRIQADEKILSSAVGEMLQLQRAHAQAQLGTPGEKGDQRLDALIRARLVDPRFRRIREQLVAQLSGMWSTDFGLVDRIVR